MTIWNDPENHGDDNEKQMASANEKISVMANNVSMKISKYYQHPMKANGQPNPVTAIINGVDYQINQTDSHRK